MVASPPVLPCRRTTVPSSRRRPEFTDQLSDGARRTTLRAVRVMFPHDRLPDEAYEKVVAKLEGDARGDESIAKTLTDGAAKLDAGGGFADLDDDAQLEALTGQEGSPYFELLKATAVVELYDQPLVWKAFGYEGPSTQLGGYVDRGFDALDWLPDPPLTVEEAAAAAEQLRS